MKKVISIVLLMTILCISGQAYAAWSADPKVNNAISTAAANQYKPVIVSDGSGGAIITWSDTSYNSDIYAQRIDASGVVQWTPNGVAISTATGTQTSPAIISDGSGGAIITWHDYRSGAPDIYAQRIDASGVVQWTPNGVAISTATYYQWYPTIISDGSGGAIITWYDHRSGTDSDIYAQRIDARGVVQWTPNGVVISTATGSQTLPTILSDGSGGAIITWNDGRSVSSDNIVNFDIYAQRIDASGVVQWTPNGVAISTATGTQTSPAIISDGSGGAIITWHDYRSDINFDIYTQRIDASGVVQWTPNGVAISTATGSQSYPTIVSDGSGGAIITWIDYRSGINSDIYSQRIDASGVVQWIPNGVAISTATGSQSYPTMVSDGSGGAIITWIDGRSGPSDDVYTQRIDANGVVQWTPNGVAIATATGNQSYPTIVSDGNGGAIITWHDLRSNNSDIYAQRVYSTGTFKQMFEESDPLITYIGTWNNYNCASCSSGAVKYSNQTRATLTFSFNGTGIRGIVAKGNMLGKARVYLDGTDMGLIDLYNATMLYQVVYEKTGLSSGAHTVVMEVSGQKNTSSTDYIVDIDAFEVLP